MSGRRWLMVGLLCTSGCEYLVGIGVLANEFSEEEREKAERLEQCGECPAGQRCNLLLDPGECRPDPGVEGDPCGEWKGRQDPEHGFGCASPLLCNAALDPPRCAGPGGVGQPCQIDEHCDATTYCKGHATCEPMLAPGAACTWSEECRPLVCHGPSGWVCAAPSPEGGRCIGPGDCASGSSCTDQSVCAAAKDPGG